MKRINLLPESLLLARAERRRRAVQVALLSVAAAGVLAWAIVGLVQVREMDGQIASAEAEIDPLRKQVEALRSLEAERDELERNIALLDRLEGPVPAAAILALIEQLLPKDATLWNVQIESPLPVLLEVVADADSRGDRGREPFSLKPIRIQIDGVAADAVAAPDMVEALNSHWLFHNARAVDSREVTMHGQTAHQYRITVDIPLIRRAAVSAGEGMQRR